MRHFCTLFDQNYLAKGLVLHDSLLRHSSEDFTLHILAMDEDTFHMLYELQLEHVDVMYFPHFEQAMNLGKIKAGRTVAEFSWTCASNLMEYLLPWMDADGITYLDADMMFFSDPKVMFDELGERSIAIVPHRLIPSKKHLEINGLFNVGWVTIRNTDTGRRCIARWAAQVREWCFNRVEEHRACGDQKYLDEWPSLYGQECGVIQNIGANLAPWNLANYTLSLIDDTPYVDNTKVVFYHAHEFQDETQLTNYQLRTMDRRLIYVPYVRAWWAACRRIEDVRRAIAERQAVLEEQAERA